MKGKVLVTGGAGFIGSHTADLLLKKGYSVRIFDNLHKNVHAGEWPEYVKDKGFELIEGSVYDKEAMKKALEGVDYVLHLSAHQDQLPNFSEFYSTNTTSTALICEIINEFELPIKKIVYASSQFVYGDGFYLNSKGEKFMPSLRDEKELKAKNWSIFDSEGKLAEFIPFEESQETNPTNSYGLSKMASERFLRVVGKKVGVPFSIVRYSIVQGERQSPRNVYSGALRIFVTQAMTDEPITVYEDGAQLRDFVNVHDVAKANVMMLEDSRTNWEAYNIGGGKGVSVKEFAEKVKEICNSKSEIKIDGSFRATDTRNAVSSTEKIKKLGWSPEFGIEKSIKDYFDWINDSSFDLDEINKSRENLEKLGVVKK